MTKYGFRYSNKRFKNFRTAEKLLNQPTPNFPSVLHFSGPLQWSHHPERELPSTPRSSGSTKHFIRQETAQRGTWNFSNAPGGAEISAVHHKRARGCSQGGKRHHQGNPCQGPAGAQGGCSGTGEGIIGTHSLWPLRTAGFPWEQLTGASFLLSHCRGRTQTKPAHSFPFPKLQWGWRGGKAFSHCQGFILRESSSALLPQQPGLLLPVFMGSYCL